MHVDYFLSLNSPWAHLGAARLVEIVARHRATLRVHSVDFGTIFPASGGLPLPKRSPLRQAYRLQDMDRWRTHLGIPINLKPRFFPADERLAAQCVIVARETVGDTPAVDLAHRVLKALWQDEANTADPATLAPLIAAAGLDPDALLALAPDPAWADCRTADTQAALARGVFGAPTYVVDGEIFWGQDRLDFLDRRLAAA
ncbi:MAG: 2-hydroxychromene-2-carboxylate isomerase [Alphaproteobacteria bacterium]|nr:MAG: 2-hydroxychromene-2-carboxylate isomerase [Alphaproteobacteria bacterium]